MYQLLHNASEVDFSVFEKMFPIVSANLRKGFEFQILTFQLLEIDGKKIWIMF